MKMKLSHALLLALLLGQHTPAYARAQTLQTPPAARNGGGDDAEAEAARAELERKALALLDEALAEAAGLKLAENRVRAQLTAARLLWPRDPAAARAAFDAAAAGVADLSARVDPEDQQFYGAAQGVMQLRGEMLQLAGQYDPKAALDFLRASRPAYAEALAAAGYGQQEQTFELNLAAQIAAREPRRALEMAEESLSRGVTTGLTNVVSNLRSKDPAAAARLAAAAVKRLRADELPLNYEASAAAQNLLHMSRPEENQPAGQEGRVAVVGGPGRAGAVPLLDEQTRRELVNKVLAALPSVTTSQSGSYNLYQALQTILPEAERYAPGRAAALRRRAEELEGALNPQARVMRMYEEAMSAGTVEALLEAAAKAPPEARDALYTQAALKAFNEGPDAARAQEILEKVSNPQQRAQTRRSMEQQEQARAARQGDFAGARQAIARMSSADDRVAALLHLANQASAARDAQAARQALEEAQAVVEAQTRGQQQFGYRLQIAQAYAGVDAGAAFEAVEAAVARLDVMLDAAAEVDGFGYDSFKDGELKSQGGFYWQDFIQRCAQTLAALAPSDFERAAAAVKKFRRPEARTTAQLALVANLLGAPRRGRRNFHGDVTPLRLSGAGGR